MASRKNQQTPSRAGDRRPPPPSFAGFALRLLAYLFLISLLFSLFGLHTKLVPVQSFIASSATLGANLLGANVSVNGVIIDVTRLKLEINHECTAVFVLLVYVAFVLAYPAPWKNRLLGALVGTVVLTTVNISRLIALTFIAKQRPDLFDYLHEYFFQGVFIALLAVLAMVWTEQVRRATLTRVAG